jgi:hypothetical protein
MFIYTQAQDQRSLTAIQLGQSSSSHKSAIAPKTLIIRPGHRPCAGRPNEDATKLIANFKSCFFGIFIITLQCSHFRFLNEIFFVYLSESTECSLKQEGTRRGTNVLLDRKHVGVTCSSSLLLLSVAYCGTRRYMHTEPSILEYKWGQ